MAAGDFTMSECADGVVTFPCGPCAETCETHFGDPVTTVITGVAPCGCLNLAPFLNYEVASISLNPSADIPYAPASVVIGTLELNESVDPDCLIFTTTTVDIVASAQCLTVDGVFTLFISSSFLANGISQSFYEATFSDLGTSQANTVNCPGFLVGGGSGSI